MSRKVFLFIIVFFLATSIVHAADLDIQVRSPSGSIVLTDDGVDFFCSFYGTRAESATWGTVAHCDAQNGVNPDGTYRFYYSVQPAMYCAGPGPTFVPESGGAWRQGSVVTFANGATYCDNTNPYNALIADSASWYRSGFSTTVSFNDNFDAREIRLQQKDRSDTDASFTSWYSIIDCGDGTSCSRSVNVQIPYAGECATTGTDSCTIQARVADFWQNYQWTRQSFNIDRIQPVSAHTITGVPDYNDGTNLWYADSVTVRVDSNDRETTNDQSGIDNIYIEPRTDTAGCSPVRSGSYTSYAHNALDASSTNAISSTGNRIARWCYYAEDNAISPPSTWGNEESPQTTASNIRIDGADPTAAIAPRPTEWSRGDSISIDVTCTDTGGSGCDTIHYDASNVGTNDVDCSPTSTWDVSGTSVIRTYAAPGTACADGAVCEFAFCAYSVDNVGHVSSTDTVTYSIDRSQPTLDPADDDFEYDPTPGSGGSPTLDGSTDNWFNDDFDVTVSIVDDGSGIGGCEYSTDGVTWIDAGCGAGSPVVGDDGDLSLEITFPVTVGPGGLCEDEGRDTCTIYFRAEDTVGNVMDTYSETVSIDYTPPSCVLEQVVPTVSGDYQHYNDSIKTHFYYNDPVGSYDGSGAYEVFVSFSDEGALSGDDVSGIMTTVFPALTDSEDSETLPMSSSTTDNPTYARSVEYVYDAADDYSGVSQIAVIDEAGNSNTCDVNLTLVPAGNVVLVDVNFTYNHVAIEDPYDSLFDANFDIEIDAYSSIPGIALGPAQIRVLNISGAESGNLAQCDPDAFDYSIYFEDTPLIHEDDALYFGDEGGLNLEDELGDLFNQLPGSCFQPYIVIKDSVGTHQVIDPDMWDSDGTMDRRDVFAVDDEPVPSNVRDVCGFFGEFDNCNERANYINDIQVDQYLVTTCASCHQGSVDRVGATVPYQGSEVSILGIDRDGYRDISDSSASYELFNIVADPARSFTIQASPTLIDSLRYAAQSKTVMIDSSAPFDIATGDPSIGTTNFLIGFRASECTSSCTLSTDVGLGTCRLDCAGFNGCPDSTNVEATQALTACDGLSAGFIANEGGTNYLCCTSPIAPGSIGTVGSDFTVNTSEVVRNERLVYIGGRLVRLVVVTFEQE